MVELLLKDATVHNVEKCWVQMALNEGQAMSDKTSQDIKNVLLTKVLCGIPHLEMETTDRVVEWVFTAF
jgi:hypothetical protein